MGTAAADRVWPDAYDGAGLLFFVLAAFGLPALGYVFLALDVRRYLRSLRRALVVVAHAVAPNLPAWALRDHPPCLAALDLRLPCTEEQVLAAYRRHVKQLHPDRGGDMRQFLRLQKHYEQALYLVRVQASAQKC
jgi:hypothetical protein